MIASDPRALVQSPMPQSALDMGADDQGGQGMGQGQGQGQGDPMVLTPAVRAFIKHSGSLRSAAEDLSTPEHPWDEADIAIALVRDRAMLNVAVRAVTLLQLYETTHVVGVALQVQAINLKPHDLAQAYASFIAMIEKLTDDKVAFIANQFNNTNIEQHVLQAIPDPTVRMALQALLYQDEAVPAIPAYESDGQGAYVYTNGYSDGQEGQSVRQSDGQTTSGRTDGGTDGRGKAGQVIDYSQYGLTDEQVGQIRAGQGQGQ